MLKLKYKMARAADRGRSLPSSVARTGDVSHVQVGCLYQPRQ
jgi:hypothetical protein